MDVKERNALPNLELYLIYFDKLTGHVWVIKFLRNVAVSAHSLDVQTIRAIMTTKFVMSLSITNDEGKLEMQPHVTMAGYPHLMP
jgi:hypothetical protein